MFLTVPHLPGVSFPPLRPLEMIYEVCVSLPVACTVSCGAPPGEDNRFNGRRLSGSLLSVCSSTASIKLDVASIRNHTKFDSSFAGFGPQGMF